MRTCFCSICFLVAHLVAAQHYSTVNFKSSDPVLDSGFAWAKRQALMYVHHGGDPVGPWYEASLPGRDAFCMRDVSHQLTGANMLGLSHINRNLLTKFVSSVGATRDWCGYWEIDKMDRPAPVDYTNDQDFWYNLPANFDVLNACYRQLEWTGERYVFDSLFQEFYIKTLDDYVQRWDTDRDGVMEGTASSVYPNRGIGSYNEGQNGMTGNDLIAAQYLGNISYLKLLERMGKLTERKYNKRATELWRAFHATWWNTSGFYEQFRTRDGKWLRNDPMQLLLLRWDFVPADRGALIVKNLLRQVGEMNVEMLSYFPREAFRYGDSESATNLLNTLTSPGLARREYPEVSFAALEAFAEGLMGIEAHAPDNSVRSLARLPKALSFARIEHLPIIGADISIEHRGESKSILINHSNHAISWDACLYSNGKTPLVNGKRRNGLRSVDVNGRGYVTIRLEVAPGGRVEVEVK